ncbi:hypothetical protein O181_118177 [Austropuccinia psidii MF-1]|uniref:Uncharacterized protein n=1 Tax=Austropuccinia psidii MF-1 TaxID=1389203 RepID=A0A9Q3KET4_9BASI|nr:hypothetical protein [Austropuccinia psidii MF-1]
MEYGQKNFNLEKIMGRNWNNKSENIIQSNDLPKASEKDENLESQQIFHTLRREKNWNQRKPGSNPSHREFLACGRTQSDSRIPIHGGRYSIFPMAVQQL